MTDQSRPYDPANRSSPVHACSGRWPIALVLAVALLTSLAWLGEPAPDTHEIRVLQTAIEMRERGDFITPYFNGQPRLNKPPLNYWLTALTGEALGHERYHPIDARIPSALAAITLVGITIAIGSLLWTRSVGLAGGLVLATTFGFVEYAHSARPEMVYAALSMGALACFLAAWRGHWPRLGPWLAWTLIGLAILAKGPQIPALLVVGLALALWLHKPSRPLILRTLMPIRGIILALLISAWWWIAVQRAVGAEAMAHSQLLGQRFMLDPLAILAPKYLYKLWPLLLPWIPLWIEMVRLMVRPGRLGWTARVPTILFLTGLVILSFGGEKRAHYLLPYLVLLSLLMALAARRLVARYVAGASDGQLRFGLWSTALGLCAGAVAALITTADEPHPPHFATWIIALQALVLLLVCYGSTRRNLDALRRPAGLTPALRLHALLAVPLLLALVGGHELTGNRGHERAIAAQMIEVVPREEPLAAVGVDPTSYVYHGRRRIHAYPTLEDLAASPVEHRWALVRDRLLREAPDFAYTEIDRIGDGRSNASWVLIRLGSDAAR